MKSFLRKAFFLILLSSPVVAISSFSQDLTGIWRGTFRTEGGDTYKLELQVKQSSNGFKGVTYSYLSTIFYGKATLTGSFNKAGQSALIRETRTVELKMSAGSVACIMKYLLDYSKSGKEEFLEGVYSSVHEKDSYGSRKGEDCGSGIVRLRKVKTSDFYVEPFLRNNIVRTPATSKPPAKTTTAPPVAKKTITPPKTTTAKPKTTTTTKAPPIKISPPARNHIDSTTVVKEPVIVKSTPKLPANNPAVLSSRKNELIKSLVVNTREVTVKLYDNGEVDGDSISVFLDKKLVLSNKRLTAAPLTIRLSMDPDAPYHELVMVAENLGRIPPNTSLMIVEAGEQRFDVRITSTEQKNAVVRFRYEQAP